MITIVLKNGSLNFVVDRIRKLLIYLNNIKIGYDWDKIRYFYCDLQNQTLTLPKGKLLASKGNS